MGRGQQSFISRWDDQFVLANPDQSPPPLDRACICRLRLVQRPGKTNYWMASAAEALERREFEQLLGREAIRLDSHERSLNERKTAADKTYTELAPLTLRAVGFRTEAKALDERAAEIARQERDLAQRKAQLDRRERALTAVQAINPKTMRRLTNLEPDDLERLLASLEQTAAVESVESDDEPVAVAAH